MTRRCAPFSYFFLFSVAKAQSVLPPDALPSIEVSLAPPAMPVPAISSAIGDMDKSRELYEASMLDNLRQFKNSMLKNAEQKIGSVINDFVHAFNSVSLVSNSDDRTLHENRNTVGFTEALTVKVNVPALTSDRSSDLISGIRGLAQSHADFDKMMFQRAETDMTSLVDFVITELTAALQSKLKTIPTKSELFSLKEARGNVGFLEHVSEKGRVGTDLPSQPNVKVMASDTSFPTSSRLIENFATRQDIARDFAGLKLNLMLIDMSKSLNQIIKRDLKAVKGSSS